jgi:hypothetical protein
VEIYLIVEKPTNRMPEGDPAGSQDLDEIRLAEEELIDAYVRRELSIDERKLVEKGLRRSPELVERLHFARLLTHAADRAAEDEVASHQLREEPLPLRKSSRSFGLTWGQRPAFSLAFAACVLIVVIGAAGLLAGWMKLRRESQHLAEQQAALERQKSELQKSASEQQLATEQLKAQLKKEQQKREADQQRIAELVEAQNQKSSASSATVATLFLLPVSRGPEPAKELKLPAGTSRIRLQLAVESIDYRGFLVEIRNSREKVIFQPTVRPPRSGKLVTITIPSQMLPPGAYSVQLRGSSPDSANELVGNYIFRIAPTPQ